MSQQQPFNDPIRVSQDGHYFTDNRGKPFLWLCDSAWPLFAEYTPEQARRYLQSRAALGYTVIQAILAWGGGTGFERPTPGPNALGQIPWLNENPATPNPAYFENVDNLVELAAGDYATGNQTGSIFPVGTKAWFACPDFWEDAVLILDGYDHPEPKKGVWNHETNYIWN